MPNRTVYNTCSVCGHKWTDRPGQYAKCYSYGCPDCGSLYWRMNNDDERTLLQ